jgi:hypothetical protein
MKEGLAQIVKRHGEWLEAEPHGTRADLREADLRVADLQGADLRGAGLAGADIDFSCFPLWCGSFDIQTDRRLPAQLAYHFCRLDCDDALFVEARKALLPLARHFHRTDVKEL